MIRPSFLAWQKATETLIKATANTRDDMRDDTILLIENQLDIREKLQGDMREPFTKEEEVLGKALVSLERELQVKLASFNKQIRLDISRAQSTKTNMSNYINPYSNIGRDGTYYDTKQ